MTKLEEKVERYNDAYNFGKVKGNSTNTNVATKDVNAQDLDRLEKLEQALDKACERLEWTCPVDQELVEDLDCENCKDTYKECWKKYFMKEVSKND